MSHVRCQPHAQRNAGVRPTPPVVRQVSASRWTAVDAVKSVRNSSLMTAASCSHAITQRDWSATTEVDPALLRASVEVELTLNFLFFEKKKNFSYFTSPYFSLFSAKLDGRTCEYSNKIYQNGEIFRPNCKHQCTCMDGAVGCVSLCPHVVIVPKMGCAKPRRMKVPGGCCEQLVCPEESPVGKKHMKKHRKDNRVSENDPTEGNELSPEWTGGSKSLPGERFGFGYDN